jgi:predicted DNA binding protein
MTFTDVVFEIRDPRDPLCRATERAEGAYVICRFTEVGRAHGTHRALVTFCGPQTSAAELLRDLHSSGAHEELEVLSITPEMANVRVALRSHGAHHSPPFLPVSQLIEAFGSDAIFEPVLFRAGRARVRLLLPKSLDTQRVLLALRELQRVCAWQDFRVVRVANLDAGHYVASLHRILTPEQEDVLRLAVSLGYYDIPKRATLDTVAKALGLSVSPVHKRLKAIEGILMTSRVEPAQSERPDFRRKPRRGTAVPRPSPLLDVALRVRVSRFPPHAFTARTPSARTLFQHLSADRATGEATALLVVLAPEDQYVKLLSDFEGMPQLRGVETVGRDREHVAVKIRSALPAPTTTTSVATPAALNHPYAWFPGIFDRDLLLKPVLSDGRDTYVRFLLLRPHTQDDLLARIDDLAKRGGWEEHEILAVRPFAAESASAPIPAPERLTARQDEVLKIAYALGYYRTPRTCTLESVANTLGVSANAIHKNLAAAELNVITSYLSAGF